MSHNHIITPLHAPHFLFHNQRMLNFCGSDPLGLSSHPDLKKNAIRFILQYGLSSASQFLVSGELSCEAGIRKKLSDLLGTESVLLFSSNEAAKKALIMCESPASSTNLHSLGAVADGNDALLCIDEQSNFDLRSHLEADLLLGSFMTLFGIPGSYLAGSFAVLERISSMQPPSHERALTPSSLGAIDAALDLFPGMNGERAELRQKIHFLQQQLEALRLKTRSIGHCIIIYFETKEEADQVEQNLQYAGIWTKRTVETAITLSICLQHRTEHLNVLVEELGRILFHSYTTTKL